MAAVAVSSWSARAVYMTLLAPKFSLTDPTVADANTKLINASLNHISMIA